MTTVDFGLMLRAHDPGYSLQELMAYNRRCIEILPASFSTLWLEDHLQMGTDDDLECLTTLTYLAALYPQFRVGPLVLAQSYRNPALLAKMAANLQTLAGGRFILGLGAGWKEDEYLAYGYPFPSIGTRMDQLEEAIQVIHTLWTEQPATFVGKHYAVRNACCAPKPHPKIPLLIGGGGEQRMLAIVARYADWWNFNSCTVEAYAHKLAILRQHCERLGRKPDKIQLSYLGTVSVAADPIKVERHPQKHYIAGSADEVIEEIEQFRALGVKHFMFRIPNIDVLEYFVQTVVPHFSQPVVQ
jgi:alkanesulfonate monooxygenase SsuD/methylene tetrahydromethanopterin reductase-like flavin-dependent oxidoreductase (luciferase family)